MEISPQVKKCSSRTRACAAATTILPLLALAACGGEGNAQPPVTSAVVANTAPPTVLAPATTVTPTTVPVTPEPTTPAAPAPSTTAPLSEEEQAKQAVIQAAERTWRLYNEAILDPTNDEKVQAARASMSGDALASATQIVDGYRVNHQRAISSSVIPVSIDIDPSTVELSSSQDVATVEFCRVGSNVLVQAGGNPDGSDLVIDDTINAYLERETYQLVAGEWLNSDGQVLQRFDGAITCEAAD